MARSVVSPSAKTVPALRATVLALKLLDKDIRRDISASVRSTLNPIWGQEVAARVETNMDALVLAEGAKITPGNPARAMAGTSRKALGGGLIPAQEARAFEFGAPSRIPYEDTYTRADSQGGHDVTRHTRRQLPRAVKAGRVAYPAFAKMGPRMVSLWVQIIVRNIHEKLEK